MNHLLLEPKVWILIIGGIAWLFQAAKKSAAGGSARPGAPDAGADERTRRVQEEVRRKIAERRSGRAAPVPPVTYSGPVASPEVAPRPVYGRPTWTDRHTDPSPIQLEMPPPETPSAEETAALVRQQTLADQLTALNDAARLAQTRQSQAITASFSAATLPVAALAADGWLADLRHPQNLRRAILLREILGPPVCFR